MGARGLLDLPAEVRLNIYRYILPRSVIVPLLHPPGAHRGSLQAALNAAFALLQVHSTCYNDIVVPFYALNTFVLHSATDATRWIKMIGRHNAALIRTIHFCWAKFMWPRHQMKDFFSVLPHLSAVQNIMFVGLGPFLSTRENGSCHWNHDALELAKGIARRIPWLAKVYRSSGPSRSENRVCFAARKHRYKQFVSLQHYGA
jgi:hypothetical protein